MTTPSFRDIELLSASLDGKLSEAELARLEPRLRSDPALAAALTDLRYARSILRSTPSRRVPHNFTLTKKLAGVRPPLPRAVPALSWGSAVAALLFVFTLGANLLSQVSFGAAAPMLSAAPMSSQATGLGGGNPSDTLAPSSDNSIITPTPEASLLMAPAVNPSADSRTFALPMVTKSQANPVNIWLYVWPGLAVLLIGAALLIRWRSVNAFRKRQK